MFSQNLSAEGLFFWRGGGSGSFGGSSRIVVGLFVGRSKVIRVRGRNGKEWEGRGREGKEGEWRGREE